LADALGETLRQVQEWQAGTGRIGADRLQKLTEILGVNLAFFFEPVAKLFGTSLNRGDVFRIGPKILSSLPENILLSFRDRASIVSV
jgi:transcriptional regulator with XRE-family HTH domain